MSLALADISQHSPTPFIHCHTLTYTLTYNQQPTPASTLAPVHPVDASTTVFVAPYRNARVPNTCVIPKTCVIQINPNTCVIQSSSRDLWA